MTRLLWLPAEHNPLSRGASLNELAVIIQLCMKLMWKENDTVFLKIYIFFKKLIFYFFKLTFYVFKLFYRFNVKNNF
jgi:hypothetical protein